jgi:hypothetical protein
MPQSRVRLGMWLGSPCNGFCQGLVFVVSRRHADGGCRANVFAARNRSQRTVLAAQIQPGARSGVQHDPVLFDGQLVRVPMRPQVFPQKVSA